MQVGGVAPRGEPVLPGVGTDIVYTLEAQGLERRRDVPPQAGLLNEFTEEQGQRQGAGETSKVKRRTPNSDEATPRRSRRKRGSSTERTPVASGGPSSAWLSRGWWQGVAGLTGIASLVLTLLLAIAVYRLDANREIELSTANLAVSHSYHRDSEGAWRLDAVVENSGPGAARIIRTTLAPVNLACGTVTLEADSNSGALTSGGSSDFSVGEECGFTIARAESLDQEELPGVFAREVDEQGFLATPAIFSATARDLLPGEVLYFRFGYTANAQIDRQLLEGGLSEVTEFLGHLTVRGDRVHIEEVEASLADHLGSAAEASQPGA